MGSRATQGEVLSERPRPQVGSAARQAAERAALYAAPRVSPLVPVITAACGLVLFFAWRVREEMYLAAGRGLGYALGIAGLVAMVTLLGYPIRKRLALARTWGSLRFWFHGHMVLGVLGPVAALLHCNFELGSINSTIALLSTALVGSSGFVGRFAYTRIHHGLFGRRQRFSQLRGQMAALRENAFADPPALAAELDRFGAWASAGGGGATGAAGRFFRVRGRARRLRRAARGLEPRQRAAVDAYLRAGQRIAQVGVYERVFSLWHAFHLPLCFFLYGAAVVHVIAVHHY